MTGKDDIPSGGCSSGAVHLLLTGMSSIVPAPGLVGVAAARGQLHTLVLDAGTMTR